MRDDAEELSLPVHDGQAVRVLLQDEIRLGLDPDDPVGADDDRERAHPVLHHEARDLLERRVGVSRHDSRRHHVPHDPLHGDSESFSAAPGPYPIRAEV